MDTWERGARDEMWTFYWLLENARLGNLKFNNKIFKG